MSDAFVGGVAAAAGAVDGVQTRTERRWLPRRDGSLRPLQVCSLGCIDYERAWELQRALAAARKEDLVSDTLLLLEHPHTYTLGRRGKAENILLPGPELERRGIAVYNVDRGGDVTYHGPGQLVGYPILKLPGGRLDFVRYIRDLEGALLLAVRDLGVPAERMDGYSGVWVEDRKVCAIGVKVDAFGVTSHGFALNVNTDLAYFDHIIPCGITDKEVTSLARELGRRVSLGRVARAVKGRIAERFDLEPRGIAPSRVMGTVARPE